MLLVCAASLVCMLLAGGQPGTRRCIPLNLSAFLMVAPLTFGIEQYIWKLKTGNHIWASAEFSVRLPVPVYAVVFALALAAVIVTSIRVTRQRRSILTLQSICEGLDRLPDGVAYSAKSGVPLLVNAKMHEICTAAFGVGVLDYNDLRGRIARGALRDGCRLERQGDDEMLLLADGTVWRLREQTLDTRFGAVTELLAFDVTRFYRAIEELRRNNERLTAVNERIREHTRSMDQIVREREILAAKIRLHDDFGRSVLAIRAYLSQPDGDRDALLALLKTPVFLFSHEEEPDTSGDLLAALEEAAAAIGIEIVYDGALPETHRNVLIVAIHECLTNTVKHADGNRITVKSRCADGRICATITNDGKPPAGTVKETGGLRNLRTMAENCGIEMTVESTPAFRLILRFDA